MKKSIITAFTLLCVLALNSRAQKAQDMEILKERIETLNLIVEKGMLENDFVSISKHYTDDIYSMGNMMPLLQGKEAVMEADQMAAASGAKFTEFDLETVEIFQSGELVVEIGKYKMTMEFPQMPEPWKDHGKYVTIYEIQKDGSLKIKVDTWNTSVNPWEKMQEMHQHQGVGEEMEK